MAPIGDRGAAPEGDEARIEWCGPCDEDAAIGALKWPYLGDRVVVDKTMLCLSTAKLSRGILTIREEAEYRCSGYGLTLPVGECRV